VKDMPVPPDRPDNLFAPVPDKAATHGIFDDKAKTRSPELLASTNRGLLAGTVVAAVAALGGVIAARR
jgi:hypothetical protein